MMRSLLLLLIGSSKKKATLMGHKLSKSAI